MRGKVKEKREEEERNREGNNDRSDLLSLMKK